MEVSVEFRLIVVALAIAFGACGPSPREGPAGSEQLPQTVVLFAPSMTEAACVLGFGERIVAITDYDRWPPEILDRPRSATAARRNRGHHRHVDGVDADPVTVRVAGPAA